MTVEETEKWKRHEEDATGSHTEWSNRVIIQNSNDSATVFTSRLLFGTARHEAGSLIADAADTVHQLLESVRGMTTNKHLQNRAQVKGFQIKRSKRHRHIQKSKLINLVKQAHKKYVCSANKIKTSCNISTLHLLALPHNQNPKCDQWNIVELSVPLSTWQLKQKKKLVVSTFPTFTSFTNRRLARPPLSRP